MISPIDTWMLTFNCKLPCAFYLHLFVNICIKHTNWITVADPSIRIYILGEGNLKFVRLFQSVKKWVMHIWRHIKVLFYTGPLSVCWHNFRIMIKNWLGMDHTGLDLWYWWWLTMVWPLNSCHSQQKMDRFGWNCQYTTVHWKNKGLEIFSERNIADLRY